MFTQHHIIAKNPPPPPLPRLMDDVTLFCRPGIFRPITNFGISYRLKWPPIRKLRVFFPLFTTLLAYVGWKLKKMKKKKIYRKKNCWLFRLFSILSPPAAGGGGGANSRRDLWRCCRGVVQFDIERVFRLGHNIFQPEEEEKEKEMKVTLFWIR